MCKTIKQRVRFKKSTQDIYDLLTDQKKLTKLTGRKALISPRPGGPFSVYDGKAKGLIVEAVRGKRLVQAWQGKRFPAGIHSMATIDLDPTPNGGTQLVLTHRGVPKNLIPAVERDWRTDYWNKIKMFKG